MARNEPVANPAGNTRNGKSKKTLKGEFGELPIDIPRDRHGSFEPQLIPKHQTRWTGFDDKILSLYARGMTVREIQGHLEEMYGTEVSPTLISSVTDAVIEDAKAWQSRALDALYPIVYLDCIHVKARDSGAVRVKAVYLALGINLAGEKELLGIWIAQTEGAKFWLQVVTELKNRGVQDIFIAWSLSEILCVRHNMSAKGACMPSKTSKKKPAAALPSIPKEFIDQMVSGPMDAEAVNAASMAFKKALIERILGAELSHHLGYPPGADKPGDIGNHRNGATGKTVLTEDGPLRIDVPRDRQGSFEPLLIPKHERRFTGFDDKIVAMYARGMTVREIQGFLAEQYGTEVSPDFISSVTDAVMAEVTAWQSRPLEPMYPVVFFDALRVKIREDAVVRNKAIYLALGVLPDGRRDILGL